jgi:hypothetical protein
VVSTARLDGCRKEREPVIFGEFAQSYLEDGVPRWLFVRIRDLFQLPPIHEPT